MSAIRSCHDEMLKRHARVVTTITIDERNERAHHLDEIVPIIEGLLGHEAKQDSKRVVCGDLK
jgi:uncharacterized protein YqgV (UPF0045/DUF77 family)